MRADLLVIFGLMSAPRALAADEVALPEPVAALAPEAGAPSGPDRSQPPPVLPPVPMELDEPTEVSLGQGARLLHVRVPGVRRVQVIVSLHQGTQELGAERLAEARLLGHRWSLSSSRYSPTELELALDRQDAWIDGWADVHDTGLRLEVARENLDPGVELLRAVLAEPAFDKRELRRDQRQTRLWLTQEAPRDPGAVVARALHFGWMSPEHPRGRRPDLGRYLAQDPEDLAALAADLKARAAVTVLVVGDVAQSQAEQVARRLVAGLGGQAVAEDSLPQPPPEATRVLAVDHPGSQARLRVRWAAPHRDHPDMLAVSAAAFALGGPFGSRLNTELREVRGWTYGVDASYALYPAMGSWTVGVDVPAEHVAGTLDAIDAEVARVVREGVSAAELRAGWKDEVSWWNRRKQTAASAGGFYQARMDLGETVARARARVDGLEALAPEAVREAAARWLGEEAPRLIVVVGPRALVEPQLAGLDVEWISAEQAVLGDL